MTHYGLWLVFASTILVILAIDLGALNKRKAPQSLREAAIWSAIWIGLSFSFAGAIWAFEGSERAMLYLTGYILEKTLSIDNLFVFLVLFRFFNIPDQQRQRVLHWGILGAIVLRFVFIYLGVSLIQKWTFILPAFGAILIFTGTKMLRTSENGSPQPENSRVLALLRKVFHVTPSLHGHSFFTRIQGRLHATPLFASLVLVEASDLVFAADSIPAALAVTSDLFLVYTSNIFAVMGLRSLYFLLEGSMQEFRYLKTGVSITLLYIGAKLLAHPWVAIPAGWSLFVICAVLTTSLAASLRAQAKKN